MFHGGTYGTYLHWCLDTLCTNNTILQPFTDYGNSHKFNGRHLINMDGWRRYCNLEQSQRFVRFHPKTKSYEQLTINLDEVITTANQAIYIYPNKESVLLTINNYYSKIWNDWWVHQFTSEEINIEKIYNNWPVVRSIPIDQIPIWIRREFLSMYLMPAWQDQVEWNHMDYWSNPDCCIITVHNILYDFELTIKRISKFCNLNFLRPIEDLLPYHYENIKLQKFINQDLICNDILQATLGNENKVWESLPLTSEAWLQWQFRNLGYELKCYNLNTFPSNSEQLRELLYKI